MLIASNYKGVILEAKHIEIVAFKIYRYTYQEITHLQTAKRGIVLTSTLYIRDSFQK